MSPTQRIIMLAVFAFAVFLFWIDHKKDQGGVL